MIEKLLVQVKKYLDTQCFEFISFDKDTNILKVYDNDDKIEIEKNIFDWVDYFSELNKLATNYEIDVLIELLEMDIFIKNNLI